MARQQTAPIARCVSSDHVPELHVRFLPGSLVSTEWLAAHLGDADLVVLDGSFKLPGVTPVAAEDFAARHIQGARFDIDAIADHATTLPHMLPSAAAFERHAAELAGISNDSVRRLRHAGPDVAGRVWWTLRTLAMTRLQSSMAG